MSNPDQYLAAILSKEFKAGDYRRQASRNEVQPILITVSRDYGAGGESIAEQLAKSFAIPLFNRELIERVAKQTHMDLAALAQIDEQPAARCTSFLHHLVTNEAAQLDQYRRALASAVMEIGAQGGGVIVGRGAHLLLRLGNALRLRVVGSPGVCAERIAEEQQLSAAEALQKVLRINRERQEAIQHVFGGLFPDSDLTHAANFDLVINTDHLAPSCALRPITALLLEMGLLTNGNDGSKA